MPTKLMIGRARWLLVRVLVGVSLAYGVTLFVLWSHSWKNGLSSFHRLSCCTHPITPVLNTKTCESKLQMG